MPGMATESSRNPNALEPSLRERWYYLRDWWHERHPDGPFVALSQTTRSEEDQGRQVTGRTSKLAWPKSLHNWFPACAFDIYFHQDGAAHWNFSLFEEFAVKAKELGLEWGGDWPMRDGPHFQLPMTWQDARDGNYPALPPLPTEEREWLLVVHVNSQVVHKVAVPEGHRVVQSVNPDTRRVDIDVRSG